MVGYWINLRRGIVSLVPGHAFHRFVCFPRGGSSRQPEVDLSDSEAAVPSTFTCPRRQLLIGAGAGGVALLAACGSSGGGASSGSTPGSGSGASAGSGALIALSSVPSDSAVSVKDPTGRILLITQSGGKLTALDATCTHMQCTVAPSGSMLQCPCHGSQYSLTGSVIQGPAPAALHPVGVKVVSGQVVLA
jgi:cytochrome b6-f complex iron-sulfur subunit